MVTYPYENIITFIIIIYSNTLPLVTRTCENRVTLLLSPETLYRLILCIIFMLLLSMLRVTHSLTQNK